MASNSSSLAHTIFSYDTNIMLAALISLLLVVLFVLLLHAYANCFFPRPAPPRPLTVSYVLAAPPRFDDSPSAPSKGLPPSLISAIPLFVYQSQNAAPMDCVICLTEFQDREVGRRLTKCAHAFHLHCIDMWLASHANCPVCRAPVLPDAGIGGDIQMEAADRNNCEIIQRDNINEHHNGDHQFHSSDSSSSSDPPLTSLVASLKRMMSRNRSEGRIFPASSNAHELDVV